MNELIVAGFDDAHTAFLARAALARLQETLCLPGHDVVTVTRSDGGRAAVQEIFSLSGNEETHMTFWKTLVPLFFAPEPPADKVDDALSAQLAAVGIDSTSRHRVVQEVGQCNSALLVMAREPAMRDHVLGVLRGFRAEIAQVRLTISRPDVLLATDPPSSGAG